MNNRVFFKCETTESTLFPLCLSFPSKIHLCSPCCQPPSPPGFLGVLPPRKFLYPRQALCPKRINPQGLLQSQFQSIQLERYVIYAGFSIICTWVINFSCNSFFRSGTGDLLPALKFLGGLHNFCNFVITLYAQSQSDSIL